MSREWKPGDVAMVTSIRSGERLARFGELAHVGSPCWRFLDSGTWVGADSPARPVVVIDPEDREQVERLEADWARLYGWGRTDYIRAKCVDAMQAALREYANPTPPKPPEPMGLGAVVEDAEGVRFVRSTFADPNYYGWRCASQPQSEARYRWSDIAAARVLSDGVTADV